MNNDDNWGPPPRNQEAKKPGDYPYHPKRVANGYMAYFDAETMEPLCWIPDRYTAWTAIYYVAFTVHRLKEGGMSNKDIRSEAERLAREVRETHLRKRAYIKSIKRQLGIALKLEATDDNSWGTDYKVIEDNGRLVMARLLPDPKRGAGSYGH